jgi:flagellar FliL protein
MAKEEAPAEAEVPKKKGKLLIIILAVVGVIVLAAGGIAAWLLMSSPDKSKKAKGHGDEEVAADAEGEEGDGEEAQEDEAHPPVYEKLEQFTVNLADQETYLQTEIQLLVATPEVQAKIKERMPEVRDAMIRLLSSKTPEELSLPDGKTKLAEEVQKEVNAVLGVKKKSLGVKKVLFGAFIIQ